MVAIVEQKKDALAALCRKYGVVRLDVFGSALREDFRPGESDIDLLADFGELDPVELVDAYFDMLEELRALLGTRVDLVMTGAIKNPYVLADVERTKQLLYAA
jgi:predicted nucleotidyltransferase